MDELALNRLVEILKTAPDIYVPVEELMNTLHKEGLALGMDLTSFQRELEADDQFEFTQGPIVPGSLSGGTDIAEDAGFETDALGFFNDVRVKLSTRQVTADAVLSGMAHNVDLLKQALLRAWENRPESDAGAEQVLREAMAMSEKLEKEIHEVISAPRPGSSQEGEEL